jgi:hypothetical protein
MKTIKQVIRQPLKSDIGLLLMTLAAAIVCLCVGQAMAAKSTEETLNKQFSTVGIPPCAGEYGRVCDARFLSGGG